MPSHENVSEISLRIDVALLGNDRRDARRRIVGDSTISDTGAGVGVVVGVGVGVNKSSRNPGRL